MINCSVCDSVLLSNTSHPVLPVPLCINCKLRVTQNPDLTTRCLWCSRKCNEKNLIPCSQCKYIFCEDCITKNFGAAECRRIRLACSHLWTCYYCHRQPLLDLGELRGWKKYKHEEPPRKKGRKRIVCEDISFGREQFNIRCVNEIDDEEPPPFTYVTQPVPGNITSLKKNPNFMSCCSCTDNCRDASKCECAQLMGGHAYDSTGTVVNDKPGGIYECSDLCACNKYRCLNRVVGNGIRFPLEVFRCAGDGKGKGWGVRCTVDIPPGSFVADYLGEVLNETDCERRGQRYGDEYLFALDAWGRSRACERLEVLGMKRHQQPRHTAIHFPAVEVSTLLAAEMSKEGDIKPDNKDMERAVSSNEEGGDEFSLKKPEAVQGKKPSVKSTIFTSLDKITKLRPGHFTPCEHSASLCQTASMTHADATRLLGAELMTKICKSRAVQRAGRFMVLCGGYRAAEPEEAGQIPTRAVKSGSGGSTKVQKDKTHKKKRSRNDALGGTVDVDPAQSGISSCGGNDTFPLEAYLPCSAHFRQRWMSAWNDARSIITDRVLLETESKDNSFTIDAKYVLCLLSDYDYMLCVLAYWCDMM